MRELDPQHLLRRNSGTPSQASNIIYLNRKVVTPCRSAASRDRPEAGLRKGVTPPRRVWRPMFIRARTGEGRERRNSTTTRRARRSSAAITATSRLAAVTTCRAGQFRGLHDICHVVVSRIVRHFLNGGTIISYGDNDIDGNTNNNTGVLTPLAKH